MNRDDFVREMQELLTEMTPEEMEEMRDELNLQRENIAGCSAEYKGEIVQMLSVRGTAEASVKVYIYDEQGLKIRKAVLRLQGCTLPFPAIYETEIAPHLRSNCEPLWMYQNGKLTIYRPAEAGNLNISGGLLPVLVFEQLKGKPIPAGAIIQFGWKSFRAISGSMAFPTEFFPGQIRINRNPYTGEFAEELVRCTLEGYYRLLLQRIMEYSSERGE